MEVYHCNKGQEMVGEISQHLFFLTFKAHPTYTTVITRWTLKMVIDYQAIFLISALIPEYSIFNEHLVCEYKDISTNWFRS